MQAVLSNLIFNFDELEFHKEIEPVEGNSYFYTIQETSKPGKGLMIYNSKTFYEYLGNKEIRNLAKQG
jgi:hypothetical protein